MREIFLSLFIFSTSLGATLFVGALYHGNVVSDEERDLLKHVVALKQQCEAPLPRTQQCMLQYIPEQQ